MKINVEIIDDDGTTIVNSESEREVPYIREIETQGFRTAFDVLETAVLEGRKEASDRAVSEYLEHMSKKNRR